MPQDAQDEPAEELLRRIESEKKQLAKAGGVNAVIVSRRLGNDEVLYSLPNSWKWVSVRDISDHRLGKMLDQHKNKGEDRPYLRNINVQWDRIDLSDVQEMRFEPGEFPEYRLESGDLLICEGGEPGRCAIWTHPDKEMMFQKAIHRVRPYGNIVPRYLLFHLWADAWSGRLAKFFTGATIRHFTGKALADYLVALPPLAEQHRIVAKVDQLMRLCDELEAGLVQTETKRRNVTAAVLQAG